MAVTCAEYEEWVAADADGAAGERARDLALHVEGCARCASLRREQEEVRRLLASRSLLEGAPFGLRTRIVARLDQAGTAQRRRAPAFAWIGVGLAAVVALLVVLRPAARDPEIAAYAVALDAAAPLTVPASTAAELESWYRGHADRGYPTHVVDLSAAGYRLVGATVLPLGPRFARLSVYSNGRQRIVCDYQYAKAYHGPLGKDAQGVYFSRGGLSFCVHKFGDEVCVLVSRMPLDAFRSALGA